MEIVKRLLRPLIRFTYSGFLSVPLTEEMTDFGATVQDNS